MSIPSCFSSPQPEISGSLAEDPRQIKGEERELMQICVRLRTFSPHHLRVWRCEYLLITPSRRDGDVSTSNTRVPRNKRPLTVVLPTQER